MNKIDRKYHLFDAKGRTVGRLATEIATILRGKNKVDFAPHIDAGDFVIVTNSDLMEFAGEKDGKKTYYRFSGYPGGITATKLKDQMEKDSRKVVRDAVYGMLAKNKLRKNMMDRLLVFKDENHGKTAEVIH